MESNSLNSSKMPSGDISDNICTGLIIFKPRIKNIIDGMPLVKNAPIRNKTEDEKEDNND